MNIRKTRFSLYLAVLSGIVLAQSCSSDVAIPKIDIPAPIITKQPTTQAVTVGTAAFFSVDAMSTGPMTYQWKKNDVDIASATDANYTTPATTIADNNASYSVVITNSHSSVTSNHAVLTVNKHIATLTMAGTLTLNLILDASGVANAATFDGVQDKIAPTGPIIYKSSDTSVATVDSNGKVTPVSGAANESTATITATYAGDSNYSAATATTIVTVITG